MNYNPLKELINRKNKGEVVGIYSACSANEYVLQAVIEKAAKTNSVALIEATANQCDQNGGYTGMTPKDFRSYCLDLAKKAGLSENRLFLGGDHLGPLTWTHLNEAEAMENAKVLIQHYVLAGFTKIHIDTSMRVADDDPNAPLSDEVIARRGACLAKVANEAYKELLKTEPEAIKPVYIVGSEVPIPGGQQSQTEDTGMQVTKVEDFKATVEAFKKAFAEENISDIWEDVIAVVVQPGVEEKDAGCTEYDRSKAADLIAAIKEYPTLIFEGHSTDYQTKYKLRELVEDGVGILKVGPGLTFSMREGLFALARIEEEAFHDTDVETSHIIDVLEEEMLKDPSKWLKYYTGNDNERYIKRKYSFSDRCRYYMPSQPMQTAKKVLMDNLNSLPEIPLNLISQFMPIQYTKIREGLLENKAEELLKDRITNTIDEYLFATHQEKLVQE
ncbi:class II D-tagatose-bisphosphate aldolase, non-catalytic subunit [Massilimicrobiota sp. An134]|uniref:class II D-tagatose-bisphosphate aldolase, non-catalytic subunit n=1 Tax=Massilimicrobiota sp. An134 TaxID=1965557 RepID=UPI000B39D7D2|nr:class II D-tagatose-bisphosphate aldolase, non-catalytic subunit [Massilimicrobiota sp. An134]OUQ24298.1 tagatose-bisphosphate aldolase [Massilimicrobiota sp. An134]